jgi:hypothetical protein
MNAEVTNWCKTPATTLGPVNFQMNISKIKENDERMKIKELSRLWAKVQKYYQLSESNLRDRY